MQGGKYTNFHREATLPNCSSVWLRRKTLVRGNSESELTGYLNTISFLLELIGEDNSMWHYNYTRVGILFLILQRGPVGVTNGKRTIRKYCKTTMGGEGVTMPPVYVCPYFLGQVGPV